jgi:hypothetical protein
MESTFTFAIAHPRFAERFVHTKAQLEQVVCDRYTIVGVDGRALSERETAASRGREGISLGQLGCALSHLEAYKRKKALDLPHGFVVEDDAVLPENVNKIIQEVLIRTKAPQRPPSRARRAPTASGPCRSLPCRRRTLPVRLEPTRICPPAELSFESGKRFCYIYREMG